VEGCGEAKGGVVVAGGLVGSHRNAAPLLELVERAFDDVATAVALSLFGAEVDRPPRAFAMVGDLVGAFGDRRSDAASA